MTMSTTPPADRPGFLARWSRRKLQADKAEPAAEQPAPSGGLDPAPPAGSATTESAAGPRGPSTPPPGRPKAGCAPSGGREGEARTWGPSTPPTRAELDALDSGADLTRFIARGVDEGLRRAALRKLFADPRFNVMDGLDVYIDDYNAPSPIPSAMLLRLQQAAALGWAAVDGAQPAPGATDSADGEGSAPDEADNRTASPPESA